jgi:hypothetical protein
MHHRHPPRRGRIQLGQQISPELQTRPAPAGHPLPPTAANLGEHQAARELEEDTLARRRRVLGQDHPSTLRSAGQLADDLRNLGEHQAARELEEDTLARRRRVLGEDHPDTMTSATNLAVDLSKLGEHQAGPRPGRGHPGPPPPRARRGPP